MQARGGIKQHQIRFARHETRFRNLPILAINCLHNKPIFTNTFSKPGWSSQTLVQNQDDLHKHFFKSRMTFTNTFFKNRMTFTNTFSKTGRFSHTLSHNQTNFHKHYLTTNPFSQPPHFPNRPILKTCLGYHPIFPFRSSRGEVFKRLLLIVPMQRVVLFVGQKIDRQQGMTPTKPHEARGMLEIATQQLKNILSWCTGSFVASQWNVQCFSQVNISIGNKDWPLLSLTSQKEC